jgi:hypothetical protein
LFRELHIGEIKMYDGIFRWEISSFEWCAFSNDHLFFCGIVGNGTLLLYGLIMGRLESLGTCFLPPEFYSKVTKPFSLCCISSYLNLVCEASDNLIFTYHISSCNFVRQIENKFPVKHLFIADSTQLIYVVGAEAISVFTVNGTPLTELDVVVAPITAASISTGEAAWLVTGHSDGVLRFWVFKPEKGALDLTTTLQFVQRKAIAKVEVYHTGDAMLVVDTDHNAALCFVDKFPIASLVDVAAVCVCGKCKGQFKKPTQCKKCGIYFCGQCFSSHKKEKG